MDHDSQLIWESYANKLDPELIKAVKQALLDGHTFSKISDDFFLSLHIVGRIAVDKSGIGPDMDITHSRGRQPGARTPEGEKRYRAIMARIFRMHHLASGETYVDIATDKGLFPDDPKTGEPRPASRQYISKLAKKAGYSKNLPRQT